MLSIPEIPVVLAFGLGATELIIILVIILIIFGAGKLPMVMQSLGSGIKSFKKAAREEDDDAKQEKDNAEQVQIEEKEVKNLSSGEKAASEETTETKKRQEVEV